MTAARRAFVRRHTSLRPVPGIEGIRLHLADDVVALWRALQLETGDPDTPLPYWAFAWGGGLALACYLRDHPGAVAGRRVLDLGAGSGLVAIAALRAGATHALAVDIDPFAAAVMPLNAAAHGVRLDVLRRDVLDDEMPADVDVVLAGDTWYEATLAERVLPWLSRGAAAGIDVLIGDPDRRYLPSDVLVELARYPVRTTSDLEDLVRTDAAVYALRTDRPG